MRLTFQGASKWDFIQPDLADLSHDCVITIDLQGIIKACNKTVMGVYGYMPSELKGQSVAILFPLEDREFLTNTLIPEVMKTGTFRAEQRNQRKLGNYIYVHLAVSLLRDTEGDPHGMILFSMDVTPQKLAGIQGDGRFEVLAQALPQLIWWSDKNGDSNYVTARTLQFFGVPLEGLAGRKWIYFVHPEDRANSLEQWNKAVAESGVFEMEYRLRRHDGEEIYHLAKALPIFDAEGNLTGFVHTSRDISSQKRAEIALRQTEKLAAVGKLASSISHEINNPLEAVTNLLYLLAGHGSLDRTAREYVKAAQEELARITEITTQTLRFHNQSTNAVATRIPDILDSVLAFYKPRIKSADLQLLREYQGTEPLKCFAGEIRQSLANIIGNAIDATAAGGRLRVRLRSSRDWKTRQKLGIRITVADTGHGMSKENQRRIFEPFFTTKGIGGTGLGLWITRDLVAKQDGTISVRSSTKKDTSGTVLSVFLPFESGNYMH